MVLSWAGRADTSKGRPLSIVTCRPFRIGDRPSLLGGCLEQERDPYKSGFELRFPDGGIGIDSRRDEYADGFVLRWDFPIYPKVDIGGFLIFFELRIQLH